MFLSANSPKKCSLGVFEFMCISVIWFLFQSGVDYLIFFLSLFFLGDCVDNTERKRPRKRTNSEPLIFLLLLSSCFLNQGFSSQHAPSFYRRTHIISVSLIGRQRSSSPSEEETTCKRPRWQDESGDFLRLLLTMLTSERNFVCPQPSQQICPDAPVHLKLY